MRRVGIRRLLVRGDEEEWKGGKEAAGERGFSCGRRCGKMSGKFE